MINEALSATELGYVRHFDNVSRRAPNDWSFMTSRSAGQMAFSSYRFQLAYMGYALALAHVHRAPAAPGAFKETFARLIGRLLEPEVWLYWRDASRAGGAFNPHLAGSPEQWDPVGKDNIMYSAYVQSLTMLFNVLFDDDRFAAPEALRFEYNTPFWGDGDPKGLSRSFAYDQTSLNEHLYWQMVQNGYLGIACEPNCVFQICNQPAILGFRMHDLLTGGSGAEEVTRGYQQAWAEFGGPVGPNGHLLLFAQEDSHTPVPNGVGMPWGDAWYGTLANTWNHEFVREHWDRVRDVHLVRGADGTMSCRMPEGMAFETETCDFGWLATWASEMGDTEALDGLLRHAELHMQPTTFDGGRFFPRHDEAADEHGNYTRVEALTGNALLAYATLNVPDGLRAIYEQPWSASHFEDPNLSEVSDVVAVPAARYDAGRRVLAFSLSTQPERSGDARVALSNVWDRGTWTLTRDGDQIATGDDREVTSATAPVTRLDGRMSVDGAAPGVYELAWR